MRFYLDESGSTGDVAKVGAKLDFGGQPIFVLAAIGVVDEDALKTELRSLASRHDVLRGELRSKHLVDKPELVAELVDHLIATESPVFVEVMEKRHLLVINLLNHLLLPPVQGFDEATSAIPMRRALAELMAVSLPDDILIGYAKACDTMAYDDLNKVLAALVRWAGESGHGQFRTILQEIVEGSRADVEEVGEGDHLQFLPLPDRSVTGRSISMLPGLSALTNVYARINKFREKRLAGVTLIHDEHMLFGDIFIEAKKLMESLSEQDVLPVVPNADYKLHETAELRFARSDEAPIQAADVLAGFIMRHFRDAATGKPRTPTARMTMMKVMRLTDHRTARGLNLVASDPLLRKAGFL